MRGEVALFGNAPGSGKPGAGERGAGQEAAGGFVKFRASRPCAPLWGVECLGHPAPRRKPERLAGVGFVYPGRHHLSSPVTGCRLRAAGLRGDTELAVGERGPQGKEGARRPVGAQSTRRDDCARASLLKVQKEAAVRFGKTQGQK